MGLFDSLGEMFKGVSEAISKVLSDSDLMKALLPVLGLVLPPPMDIIAVVGLMLISSALGQEEDPEKLGYQMQEADKRPEDFDTFAEYKEYLDEHFPFDKDKFDAMTEEQKRACRYVGLAGTMAELKESTGFEITPETLEKVMGNKVVETLGLDKNDNQKIGEFAANVATELQKAGFTSLQPVSDAANGKISVADGIKVEAAVQNAIDKSDLSSDKSAFEVIASLADK